MENKKLTLPVMLLAGMCLSVAPAWAQSSPSSKPTDPGDQQIKREGRTSGESSGGDSIQGTPGDVGGQTKGTRGASGQLGRSGRESGPGMSEQTGRQTDIRKVQEALKDKGFDPGPIDGVMGPKTQEALKNFQQANNLTATGSIDSETAQKLGVKRSGADAAKETTKKHKEQQ